MTATCQGGVFVDLVIEIVILQSDSIWVKNDWRWKVRWQASKIVKTSTCKGEVVEIRLALLSIKVLKLFLPKIPLGVILFLKLPSQLNFTIFAAIVAGEGDHYCGTTTVAVDSGELE